MSITFACPGCGSLRTLNRLIGPLMVAILLASAPSSFAQTAAPTPTAAPVATPSVEFPSADPLNKAIDAINADKTITTVNKEKSVTAAVEEYKKKIGALKMKWDAEVVDVAVSDKATSTYSVIVTIPQLSFLGNITITQPLDEKYATKLVVGKNPNFKVTMTFRLKYPDEKDSLYGVVRDKISIDNAPMPLVRPTPTATAAPTSTSTGPINLLRYVDPAKDAVSGTWSLNNGELTSSGNENRLEFPYHPPDEYDFEISFTIQKANTSLGQILSKAGIQFCWKCAGWKNTVAGFEMIDGKSCLSNPSTAKSTLAPAVKHTSLVQVRRESIKGYIDGQLVSQYHTTYGDMSLDASYKIPGKDCLGLATWYGPVIFHSVRILEVTGKGKLLREPLVTTTRP